MNKTLLILQREYVTRVRKKSFLLTTFLVPIFFISMYVGVIMLTKKSFEETYSTVYIIDDTHQVATHLQSNKNINFISEEKNLNSLIHELAVAKDEANNHILLIDKDFYTNKKAEFLSFKNSNIHTQHDIEQQLQNILKQAEYKRLGININMVNSISPVVKITSRQVTKDGDTKESSLEVSIIIAMTLSVLIYISLFLYGTQVMRGVIEEKSSRIVEVIISSVRPFQLMMGKIVGIGLVGLTQFVLWLLLSLILVSVASFVFVDKTELLQQITQGQASQLESNVKQLQIPSGDILHALQSINFVEIITSFFVFFLGGYLIYSALFAAVGSAVDSETEASQFTLPITMPLLLTYLLSFGVLVNNPHGNIATWLSFIPFTSPIAMMVRMPFGVPTWQIILSAILLIGGFMLTTWIAARIYRTGILMHGKKASYKELLKWIKYKG